MNKERILLVFLSLYLFSEILFAAEKTAPHWQDLLAGIINWVLLFGGLFLLLRKGARRYLQGQSDGVRENIRKQESALREAEKELSELRRRKTGLEQELATRQKENDRRVEERIQQMESDLEVRIKRHKRRVAEEIEEKLEFLRAGIREEIADAVLKRFQKDLEKKLDQTMQDRIIRLNIRQIGENYEA